MISPFKSSIQLALFKMTRFTRFSRLGPQASQAAWERTAEHWAVTLGVDKDTNGGSSHVFCVCGLYNIGNSPLKVVV